MQLGKYAKLVKREGFCALRTIGEDGIDGVYLATRSTIFRDDRFPPVKNGEAMAAVLDMPEKDWCKVSFSSADCEGPWSVMGMDLRDSAPGDRVAKKLEMAAFWKEHMVAALVCQDEELVFYDESLLSPVQKELADSRYVEYRIRQTESGGKYVVVKNCFELVAAVMPVEVISVEYLSRLQEFQTLSIQQFEREKIRRELATVRTEQQGVEADAEL